MRLRLGIVAATAALAVSATLTLLLTGSAVANNPTVLPFQGSFTATACGTPFDFQVPSGTGTIDVVANATAPTDDILLKLVHNGTTLGTSDEGTSPEAVHYSNGGTIPSGTYSAIVCPSPNPLGPFTLMTYSGTVTLTDAAAPNPNPNPPSGGPAPAVSFDTSTSLTFAPASLVSAHFLCGEPQETVERPTSDSQAGRIDPNRIFVDCPLTSRSQTSLLQRSADGGKSFRLLLDPTCPQRNRPNCMTLGGGDSEEDVNLTTGNLFFADQEGLTVQEGLSSSTDHGDTFPAARQYAITNPTTATDRQWLAWVDPRNATVAGQGLEAFFTWHLPGAGQYVLGVGPNGLPLPQPVPQIPNVSQSGQPRVDNSDTSPGRGWIYQPFGGFTNGGIMVATAFAPQYQNPASWQTTEVSGDTRSLFPWVAIDASGNAYLAWINNVGKLYISASPISDPRNNPQQGGRPGTYWTTQAQINRPDLTSTAFAEVTAAKNGRVAVAYYGTSECTGQSDNCGSNTHWNTYVDLLPDATQLWKGGATKVIVGQVSHRVDHVGNICTAGTTCGTTCTQLTPCQGDRSLLDMMDVSFDSNGRVAVVYMDNNNALGNIVSSSGGKNSPFVEYSKEITGPSMTGSSVNVSAASQTVSDAAGDATWPNTAAGTNLPSLDLLGASISNTSTKLTATVNLANSSLGQMGTDLGAYNAASPTDTKARIQYIVRLEAANDVYHLDAEYQNGALRFFGGKIDSNDAVQNGTGATVGSRYVTDAGYTVTGSVGSGSIKLSIPLSQLGLKSGDKILNVTAFATVAPSEDDSTASLVVNSARTVDATPSFDAKLK